MRTARLVGLALASLLTLHTLTAAAPRPRPTPTPTTLSEEESLCEALGVFTYKRAADRDGGLPLLRAIDLSRQWDVAYGVPRVLQKLHEDILRKVYASPAPPHRVQQQVEVLCLNIMAQPTTYPQH
jgi:hypothetical protein